MLYASNSRSGTARMATITRLIRMEIDRLLDELRYCPASPTISIADAAVNEGDERQLTKDILSERPWNEKRRRARSAFAADAVLGVRV